MKKLLFTVMMLCEMVQMTSAQVKFGIEAGTNISSFISGHKSTFKEPDGFSMGFQIGGNMQYQFYKGWNLETGLTFMHLENKAIGHQVVDRMVVRNERLVLPLRLGHTFLIGDKMKIIPSAGMFASYCLGGTGTAYIGKSDANKIHITEPFENKYVTTVENGQEMNQTIRPLHHFNYGVTAGVKAMINNHYTISLNYMSDLWSVQYDGLHSYNYSLSIGYTF